jgi:hypothetical protein
MSESESMDPASRPHVMRAWGEESNLFFRI